MKCPRCYTELKPTDHQGVEIDRCSECCGIWLDHGELQKIVSLTSATVLELAKTMAEKIVDPEGGPGKITIAYVRKSDDEDQIRHQAQPVASGSRNSAIRR